jgi:hypothetical protein
MILQIPDLGIDPACGLEIDHRLVVLHPNSFLFRRRAFSRIAPTGLKPGGTSSSLAANEKSPDNALG